MDGDRAPRGRDDDRRDDRREDNRDDRRGDRRDDRERDGGGVQRAPRERSTRNDLPRGDREDGRVSSDTLTLSDQDVAYLVGRGGQTRVRLEAYSGAQLELNHGAAEVSGSKEARGRAKLAIQITLQQRNGGKLDIDYSVLEQREDLDIIDVPMDSVGFVLGAKGQALRALESKYQCFMFFDNESVHKGCKRLYVLGPKGARADAIEEVRAMVATKEGRGSSRGPPPPPFGWGDRYGGPPPQQQRGYEQDGRSRGGYAPREEYGGRGGYDGGGRPGEYGDRGGGGGYGREPARGYERGREPERGRPGEYGDRGGGGGGGGRDYGRGDEHDRRR